MSQGPDVVGPNEAAQILGCSRQHLYRLAERDGFPPATHLVGGPVWDTSAIRAYAVRRAPARYAVCLDRRVRVFHLDTLRQVRAYLSELNETRGYAFDLATIEDDGERVTVMQDGAPVLVARRAG